MKKLLVSVLLVVSVFSACVVSANAIDKITTIAEIIKWGLTPEQVGVGEDELLARYNELETIWRSYSNITSMAKYYVSYDTLCGLMVELNQAGYPCNIEFNRNLQIYVIFGTNKSLPKPVYDITGKYLTNGSRGVICAQFNTDSLTSSISSKVDSLAANITQLMASNGYLASINNKLASLTSIGTKLDTISGLLNANTYCCGYTTNSSGAEFPTQAISYPIAEQIVARLNSEMQGKNLTVLKRDGSGTTTSTFRRAYVTSSSMICLVMSGGTYYLCDSSNTIFKAGADRLSNIYTKVNSMATTLTNIGTKLDTLHTDSTTIAGYIDTVESKLSTLATKLDTLHTDNTTIAGYIDTVETKLSTLHTDAAAVTNAIMGLPNYSGRLDNIAKLLTTTTYTCGFLTDSNGTAYETIPISYDSAEAIVARLNTQLPAKQITCFPREGVPYSQNFDYCTLDSSLYIRVYSGQYSYYLCDSGNRLFRASADRVTVIDSRLVGINNVLASLGQKLDKLPTSYPLPDLTGIESGITSLGKKLDKLPTSYPVPDLTGIESGFSTLGGKLDTLHVDAADLIAAITDQPGSSAADLTGVTDRLDQIITLMQATDGVYSCDHTYTQDMAQEATCGLPGLMVSTCSKCGNSYSEIVSALGHDWKCTEHVEDETDPATGEVTKAGYDIYTCTRCDETYEDHSGNGAPADYGDTSISKIIVSLFAKLGTFAGKVVSWVINLFDKALGSLDTLITRFSELTGQITSVGGDYPAWLSGFWAVLPEELQLVLTFAFICIFVGVVGRKLFFV